VKTGYRKRSLLSNLCIDIDMYVPGTVCTHFSVLSYRNTVIVNLTRKTRGKGGAVLEGGVKGLFFVLSSVPDPHCFFGPPGTGSGSISQRYGSRSCYLQAIIVRKTLIPIVL